MVAKIQASGYNPAMKTLFGQFLDLIFPPRCFICKKYSDQIMCGDCMGRVARIKLPVCRICGKPFDGYFAGDICGDCLAKHPPFIMARSASLYEGVMKDAIHKFKFGGKKALSSLLGQYLISYLDHGDIHLADIDLIVPVPLSMKRERDRGYNQSKLLAEEISRRYSKEIDCSSLVKIKDITPQFDLTREKRLMNVKGAFKCAQMKAANVLLIDDIYTTGATAMESSSVLKAAGAGNVHVLTLARAIN